MKRREVLTMSLAAPAVLLAAPAGGQFASWIAGRWTTSKTYTLAFLEKMPEEHYGFKPVPEIDSFAQQAAHMAEGNFLIASGVREAKKPQLRPKELTRSTLTAFVASSFDYGAETMSSLSDAAAGETISFFNQKVTKRDLCFRLLDHVAHHRGQMVIYLRLKGITPPEYPG